MTAIKLPAAETPTDFDLYHAMADGALLAELDRRGIDYYPEVSRFAAIRMLIVDDRTAD